MVHPTVLSRIVSRKKQGKKSWAILIDPDKAKPSHLELLVQSCETQKVDFLMVGGSLITSEALQNTLLFLKQHTHLPVVLFPGSNVHIHEQADALLFLSLLSGRNPEFLIGQQVVAAPKLRNTTLEVIPTGYLLIDGGRQTTASYISNTVPIPNYKPDIAAATALAGQLMGMQLTYLDSGSGADEPVSEAVIQSVAEWVQTPVVVGGGIDSALKAKQAWNNGADLVVMGNAIEHKPALIEEVRSAIG